MSSTDSSATPPPAWLRWFVNDAARGIVDHESAPPVGCHYYRDDATGTWEVSLFVGRTEVIGGPRDGHSIPCGMQIDIARVRSAFDSEPQMFWQSEPIAPDDELGNHLSFEGRARGHDVWLRILHDAPALSGTGRLFHPGHGVVEDLW